MREFDLELAKQGYPVCTRSGHDVRIVCFDYKIDNYPIIALIQDHGCETIHTYTLEGKFYQKPNVRDANDLMMAPCKREGWVNVYKDNRLDNRVFNTEDEALSHRFCNYLATVKIEWKE